MVIFQTTGEMVLCTDGQCSCSRNLGVIVDELRLKNTGVTLCAHCVQAADNSVDYCSEQASCDWYSDTSDYLQCTNRTS